MIKVDKKFKDSIKESDVGPIDSVECYKLFWLCLRIVGIGTGYNKIFCGFYDIMINIFVTIAYPLHLTIGLFMNPTLAELFQNIAITITCITCSIKHYVLRYKLKDIQTMQRKLAELDKSSVDTDERAYFHSIPKVRAQRVLELFFTVYTGANISAAALAVLSAERRLLYPAWLPFDWQSSDLLYWLALVYQIFGVSIQIVQNLANDIFLPMSLCIVGGHVRLLKMRIAKIGHQTEKSTTEHRNNLIDCMRDHKKLVQVFQLLQSTVLYAQLVQFLSSGLTICGILVCLLFYSDNIFAHIYFTVYFIAMGIEIFPCCYYGSLLEEELYELPIAIFNSNWLLQSPKYKKDLLIFTQLTLMDIKLTAGGFVDINLNAFFGICKMAYSLFTVILSSK